MRRTLDQYPTETAVTQALIKIINVRGQVLEACAGAGLMAQVLRQRAAAVFTNDIDPQYGTEYVCDASDPDALIWQGPQWDWVITNPPFNKAHRILPLAWEHCRVGVAFLLRLSYQEPAENRAEWLKANSRYMSHMINFNPRPSFTGDGRTDSVTTAWMVWQWHHHQRGTQMEYVTKWKR